MALCTKSVPSLTSSVTTSPALSTTKVSLPVPPINVSLPTPPSRTSLPAPPLITLSRSFVVIRSLNRVPITSLTPSI
ncbi:MAG: hypothetical protein CMO32_21975 [Variovorax sp.]|nr:hypothetical protein [Variovorax sp.]